jgi:hypothetical protein
MIVINYLTDCLNRAVSINVESRVRQNSNKMNHKREAQKYEAKPKENQIRNRIVIMEFENESNCGQRCSAK